MELKTKYITADDFKQYFGIDLEVELKTNDNPSDEVNAFLKRIENRMGAFINARFYKNVDIDYKHFTDYQKEHYKRLNIVLKPELLQIMYLHREMYR